MQISDEDKELLIRMKNDSPEYYDLFLRMKKTFAEQSSIVTHDIRNHATVLHGTMQILESKLPDITQHAMWGNFSNAIHSLIDYLNTTSEFRYAANCKISKIDILDILWNIPSNIENMFEDIHESYFRNYLLDFPLELDQIDGDYERINASLLAITRNAVEATGEGDEIYICSHSEDDFITITVTDHGRGIAPEIMPRVGEPFVSDKASHAGVGLATAKLVARQHGGDLTITPLDNGTAVSFRIRMHSLQ
ncbi:MAG: sensor histidine kinase [Bacteroides sp.]